MRPEDQWWEEHGTATPGHGCKGMGRPGVRSWDPGAVLAGLSPRRVLFMKPVFNGSEFRKGTFQKG